ncbi:nuclear transport factor 2 family protein [Actinoplanes sp. LDG1-06]|uniref:Nuclear transport factor 2 family protein n=1 Tax=Paractinoplanes ovalisporus TaxID=2810368 RepID=A0ABS2AKI4_9ACTN|nr:nuclear transport factor 2 family protein [Actinoplanes ovalisporus]MBM2619744.1 nuclear transport factor 2 family protein [Actinoplanes ovalisporus]
MTADDRLQIQEVIALHGHLCDAGAYDRFDLVFTSDLVVDTSDLGLAPVHLDDQHESRLAMYISVAHRKGPGDILGMHATNVVVREDGDGARAWSKGLTVNVDGAVASFVYADQLVRTTHGWRIRHRKVSPRRVPGGGPDLLITR